MKQTLQAITRHEAGALAAGQARLTAFAATRIQQTTTIRTRRALAAAQADKMQSALEAWLEMVYSDLRYHVHPLTCAIVIPCPWSRAHHRHYALSEAEGRLLACLVGDVVGMLPVRRRLIEFDGVNRWILNLTHFPTLPDALTWLRGPCRVSADAVLEGWLRYPQGRRIVRPAGRPSVHPSGQ